MRKREEKICMEIYEANKNLIYRYLQKKHPYIPREDLRDVMQELWLDLVKDIRKVIPKDEEGRRSWLLYVANLECLNWYRRNRKSQVFSLDETDENSFARKFVDRFYNPVQEFVEEKLLTAEILRSLTQREREVLYTSYVRKTFPEEKHSFTNAERCRNYRVMKKLKERFAKGELDG